MSSRRTTIIALLLALISITVLAVIAGCDSTPEAPVYNNPFDPNGTEGGDPFHLVATLGDTTITLVWDQPQGYNLTSYEVWHSTSIFNDFVSIGTVEATTDENIVFIYINPEPTTTHYFKIQAYNASGNFTAISHIVPASSQVLARVVINDGSNSVASRFISLNITVTDGDSLRISQTDLPESEIVMDANTSGTPTILPWDLGSATTNDTTMTMNVVVQFGPNLGDTNKIELELDFTPRLALAQGGIRVASLIPPMTIEDDGLVSMRFASSQDDLANLPWIDGAPTYDEYHLVDTANPQIIFAEFLGDFGFTNFQQLSVRPDLLTDPTFTLVLPADHISDEQIVKGVSSANATLMRFSESLDFSSIPWIVYSDTTLITLSPEAGEKVIYAQYRNDFSDSPILTDYVIHVSQLLDVTISAPVEGDVVRGGTFLLVQGTAIAPAGNVTIDLVEFDGGDGFIEATGTNNWSYNWEIPRYIIDTDLAIRAKAWAGEDFVISSINLLVTQLVVGITSPEDGASVSSDTDIEISGFALAATGGDAIDSVIVNIDGVNLLAEGTGAWTIEWHSGVVDVDTDVLVSATVYAGNDSYTTTSTIIVTP